MQTEHPDGSAHHPQHPHASPSVVRKTLGLRKKFEDFDSAPPPPSVVRKTLGLRKKFEDFDSAPPPPRPAAGQAPAPLLRGRSLGEILVAMGLLTSAQVQATAEEARLAKEPLGRHLVRCKLVSPQQLCKALSLQSGLPVVDFPSANVPVAARYSHLLGLMARLELVPFSETDQVVCVAAQRPPSPQRVPEIEKAFNKQVRVCLAPDEQIAAVLHALGAGRPTQKRRHSRFTITMPVWLQLCSERNETLGPKQGGQILDISLSGLRVEGPEGMLAQLKELRRGEPHIMVRFSTPPLEVHGTCVVRYVRNKENAKPWERLCVMGLEIKTLGPGAHESFKVLHERAEIAAQRLEQEFGPASHL